VKYRKKKRLTSGYAGYNELKIHTATHSDRNHGYTLHNKPFSFVLKLIGSGNGGDVLFSVTGHIPVSNEPI
jgi:hypothetical protein